MDQLRRLGGVTFVAFCGLCVAAWKWIPLETLDPHEVSAWLAPHRLGMRRVERLGGERIVRVSRELRRNGTLAVFFFRKVPVPFLLTNIVVGASSVRYGDFMLGTVLGMGAFVVALAGFGYQLTNVLRQPSLPAVVGAALFISVPLSLAWLINRSLRHARPAA